MVTPYHMRPISEEGLVEATQAIERAYEKQERALDALVGGWHEAWKDLLEGNEDGSEKK
jgi:hypothetical protein